MDGWFRFVGVTDPAILLPKTVSMFYMWQVGRRRNRALSVKEFLYS
jgi:hypothetical protein